MTKKMLNNLFKKKEPTPHETIITSFTGVQYSYVEKKIDENQYRMGIRFESHQYKGVIFTTSPKVALKDEEDGTVSLDFRYIIEKIPTELGNLNPNEPDLSMMIGDIVADIIRENYNNKDDNDHQSGRSSS